MGFVRTVSGAIIDAEQQMTSNGLSWPDLSGKTILEEGKCPEY
jgi:hypothetical protein